jgi:hypothetical protein
MLFLLSPGKAVAPSVAHGWYSFMKPGFRTPVRGGQADHVGEGKLCVGTASNKGHALHRFRFRRARLAEVF